MILRHNNLVQMQLQHVQAEDNVVAMVQSVFEQAHGHESSRPPMRNSNSASLSSDSNWDDEFSGSVHHKQHTHVVATLLTPSIIILVTEVV